MNRKIVTIMLLCTAAMLGGCATAQKDVREVQEHAVLGECLPGQRCVDHVPFKAHGRGGGVHKVTFLTQTNAQGQQVTAPVVTSSGSDRLDALWGAGVMGVSQVGSALIMKDAAGAGGGVNAVIQNLIGVEQTLGPGLAPVDACDTCGK